MLRVEKIYDDFGPILRVTLKIGRLGLTSWQSLHINNEMSHEVWIEKIRSDLNAGIFKIAREDNCPESIIESIIKEIAGHFD